MNKLIEILPKFQNKKILVVGDIMLDKYIWGKVDKISPEAPVQVVNVIKESFMPGGAGNAANNIASLKGIPYLAGIIGNDNSKITLMNILKEKGINTEGIIERNDMPTIQKIRIMARSQQLLRIDYEEKARLNFAEEEKIFTYISKIIDKINVILISDYAKGVITKSLMEKIIELSRKYDKKVIIDPKPKNKEFYKNCYVLTPNFPEALEMAKVEECSEDDVGKKLIKEFNSNILITKSEEGISLFEKNKEKMHLPTKAREVYDVSGAGDTMVAALALAIASGASLKDAAIIANYAAGITVGKIGTSTVSQDELKKAIENDN